MIEILEALERWRASGRRIALATLIDVDRSAPRDPGATLAVSESGEIAGSISGGCVEAELFVEAQQALATGRPRLVSYGISDETATEHGLTCGGTLHVFVEPMEPGLASLFERLAGAIAGERPVALATRLDAGMPGAKLLVDAHDAFGFLGTPGLDYAVEAEARALLSSAQTVLRTFGPDGEPIGVAARIFIQSFAPKPDLFVFGAVDFSRAMATVGRFLGYRVTVVDARPAFATKARLPDADEIVVAWPDEFLAKARVGESTALVVLTHDVKFDVPLLQAAFATNAGYIGVMGSRNTHARRLEALRAAGATDEQLARLWAPVGLDIGARTPEETAISIAAEIVASRAGRQGGRLRDSRLPVHGPPPAPQATLR